MTDAAKKYLTSLYNKWLSSLSHKQDAYGNLPVPQGTEFNAGYKFGYQDGYEAALTRISLEANRLKNETT